MCFRVILWLKNSFKTASKQKIHLIRYADDFIITGESKEILENEIKPVVENFLKERGLELSKEKTLITNIEKGFDFLGMNCRKYNGKLLIKPSKTKVLLFLKKIKTKLRENLNTPPNRLIMFLNPILRGWGNYYQRVVSKQTFSYVDSRVWLMIWKWTRRRHPSKSKTWRKRKYYKTVGSRALGVYGNQAGKWKGQNFETIQSARHSNSPTSENQRRSQSI